MKLPSFIHSTLNSAGGLGYHYLALKYRHSHWLPFIKGIDHWLHEWKPPERNLILIGPSSGYCLSRSFLARFNRVVAVDPDPVAATLFQFRLGSVRWDFRDYISPRKGKFSVKGLIRLKTRYPDSAVLFCNFLGQLPVLFPKQTEDRSFEVFKQNLPEVLQMNSWASFHDRVSGRLRPRFPNDPAHPPFYTERELSNSELIQQFFSSPAPSSKKPSELTDHETGGLFPNHRRSYFDWEIRPGVHHLIEAVQHCQPPSSQK